jgi:small subunit ribosomal protein S8
MSLQDPVSDMLTRIRNAQMVAKECVCMPSSKVKVSLAQLLQDEGYINGFSIEGEVKKTLSIQLRYHREKPVIEMVKRISRPGLRVYVAATKLPKVLGGLGISIISTSQGLMSDRKARSLGLGGEIVCQVA